MRSLAALIVAAVVLYVLAVNYAATESRFQCAGMLMSKVGTRPAIADLNLHRYRWWAAWWRGADGYVRIEMPGQSVDAVAHIDQTGDVLVFFDDEKKIQGTFSLSRSALNLETPRGLFGGTCVPVVAAQKA